MSRTISRLNSSLQECFSSQSPLSLPDNESHIKTGLQGCEYLRINIAITVLPLGYPFYPHRPYACFHECVKNSPTISKGQIWQEMMTMDMLHFFQLKKLTIFPKSINKQKEKNSYCKKNERSNQIGK